MEEMDLVQINHDGEGTEDASIAQSPSSEPTGICDVFGNPEILPRIGDKYQVDIPTLSPESDYLQLTSYPTDAATVTGAPHCFLLGLPVPIMWVTEEAHILIKREDLELKIEPSGVSMENELCMGESVNLALQLEMKKEMHQKCGGKGHYPAPGSLSDSWSDLEKATFLLGLYIFGKNLVQVKRFVESKKMRDLLSFYYGKFYKSAEYRRWAECRKMRSRRCIYGQRIFTGLRQQELLSRLLPHLSEQRQNILLEVSKTFGEGKILLEEYVSTLKATVGMNIFIEAVGIGKGRQDLTGIALEPLKHNQVAPVRPEMPIGKACSSLTPQEIIKCLTGDFRLSKARSSDLFWEAVWPRLLARGWHSEQPRGHNYAAGSKQPLVFLIPGVKKFSRRKLVKGSHYFDSVSDVLSKVASDPGLLEFEIEADEGNKSKEESGLTNETKLDKDDLSDQRHHCYLQPRTPNRNVDIVKFTVVDTSLANGAKYKEKEVRSLPFESSNTSTSSSHFEENDEDTSEELVVDESNSDSTSLPAKVPKSQNTNMYNAKKQSRAPKCHLGRKMKPDMSNYLAPVTKRRRRLTACSRAETSQSTITFLVGPELKQEESGGCIGKHDSDEIIHCKVVPLTEKLCSSSSSCKDSRIDGREGMLSSNCSGAEHPREELQFRTMIDLNLPVLPDAETGEPVLVASSERQDDQASKQADDPNALKTSIGVANSEQPPNMNSRRQSTRNRPLTTKALEALASGFLNTRRRRRKRTEAFPGEDLISRPSRRARCKMRVTESFGTGIMDSKVQEEGNGVCNDNEDMFSKFHIRSEGEGAQFYSEKYQRLSPFLIKIQVNLSSQASAIAASW
ncbi:unnamed protein product, partial [Vitis vinifera]